MMRIVTSLSVSVQSLPFPLMSGTSELCWDPFFALGEAVISKITHPAREAVLFYITSQHAP